MALSKKVSKGPASNVKKDKVTKEKVMPANASLICQLDHAEVTRGPREGLLDGRHKTFIQKINKAITNNFVHKGFTSAQIDVKLNKNKKTLRQVITDDKIKCLEPCNSLSGGPEPCRCSSTQMISIFS